MADKIIKEIEKRLSKRMTKRKGKLHANRHETFGKVTEEYNEYAFEVQTQSNKRMVSELYDIIDACVLGILTIEESEDE